MGPLETTAPGWIVEILSYDKSSTRMLNNIILGKESPGVTCLLMRVAEKFGLRRSKMCGILEKVSILVIVGSLFD
jgi:hypothetical protein